ncbi:hypothetical protein CLV78_104116 [Aliiruegeria haliotis]|uniref:Uncharacterized protein n=1 Tax=Aliiruegeria haliotis TaxID=1280846 RepID=A0A2T0RR01_9RHOB|nr:hypothetical protein CLV78_104116 [Aliiruegeria haliotis]
MCFLLVWYELALVTTIDLICEPPTFGLSVFFVAWS